jgi:beta-catenin-like protein 1
VRTILIYTYTADLPTSKGKQRATAVTVEDEDDADQDMQAATDLQDEQDGYNQAAPPGGDGDYFAEDDEDGRFFGGGLSSTQKQILDIFDEGDQAGEDDSAAQRISIQSVRRQLLNLERTINKNSEMRIKWSGQADK